MASKEFQRGPVTTGPVVTLVGAPNVGKSTLFNRLVGLRRAIVTNRPGVTRDRIYGLVRLGAGAFTLCDTGGLFPVDLDSFSASARRQTEAAIGEATVLLFLVDGRSGLTPLEEDLARDLRVRGKEVLLAVNKVDEPADSSTAADYYRLGFGVPVPISAEHGLGIGDLLERLEELLGPLPDDAGLEMKEETTVAVLGRPNVGKSSLLNRLLGQDRLAVSELAGTTRDAVDILFERDGHRYRFIDTAGLRRRGKTSDMADVLSLAAARRSIERADVVLFLIDASAPLTAQDLRIAGQVAGAHRPLVLVANKWDLVTRPDEVTRRLRDELVARIRFARCAPLATASALTGLRVERLFPLIDEVDRSSRRRLTTPELNRFLREEGWSGRVPRLLYMTQTGISPPSFLIFTRDASRIHFSVRRRLENRLRERFGLGPTPLILRIRSRSVRRDAAR